MDRKMNRDQRGQPHPQKLEQGSRALSRPCVQKVVQYWWRHKWRGWTKRIQRSDLDHKWIKFRREADSHKHQRHWDHWKILHNRSFKRLSHQATKTKVNSRSPQMCTRFQLTIKHPTHQRKWLRPLWIRKRWELVWRPRASRKKRKRKLLKRLKSKRNRKEEHSHLSRCQWTRKLWTLSKMKASSARLRHLRTRKKFHQCRSQSQPSVASPLACLLQIMLNLSLAIGRGRRKWSENSRSLTNLDNPWRRHASRSLMTVSSIKRRLLQAQLIFKRNVAQCSTKPLTQVARLSRSSFLLVMRSQRQVSSASSKCSAARFWQSKSIPRII